MPKCKAHGRSVLYCLACFPRAKKRFPKGFKACRCKMVLIPKDLAICVACVKWEQEDWLDQGHLTRRLRFSLVATQ